MLIDRIVCFCLGLLAIGHCLNTTAQDFSNQEKAKEVYFKAKSNLNNMNYMTESVSTVSLSYGDGNDKKIFDKFFHKLNKDGTVLTRRELVIEPQDPFNPFNPLIVIENVSGRYELYKGGNAYKIDFQKSMNEIDETGLDISYSLEEDDCNNVSCYVVTKKIQPTDLVYERYSSALPKNVIASKQRFADNFASTSVLYIGKNDLFFRKVEAYSANGKYLGVRDYGNVSLNIEFKNEQFEIPKGVRIIAVSNADDYMKNKIDAYKNNSSDIARSNVAVKKPAKEINKQQQASISNDTFSGYLYFLFAIGVLCIVFYGVVKLRNFLARG